MKTIIFKFIKKYWKIISLILMILIILLLCNKISNLKSENSRLESNYYAMCDSANTYKTKSGKLATQTKNLELNINELNALYSDAKSEIKDLNVKIKNLKSFQRGVVEKEIHDTIALHDTIIDNKFYKSGIYSDDCTDISFIISDTSMNFDLLSNDVIDILISTEKEGKWYQFWKWPRKKNYVTTATSSCPNTKVSINTCTIKK